MTLPGPENIHRAVLDNGITVLVYESYNAQSVFLVGTLECGSLYVEPARKGLAALTASSLMWGTQHRSADEVHSALEDIGADVHISSGAHKMGFSAKSLAEDLPTVLEVLADVIRRPTFPRQQVERIKGETLTWLQYRQQDTRWQAGRLFRENLYGPDHPYHYGTNGTAETLAQLTADDLSAFHARSYGPQGMVLAVAGAVPAQQAVEVVRRYFEDWRNPQQPPLITLPQTTTPPEIRRSGLSIPGKSQTDLVIGVVGPSRQAEDYHAASMSNSILGQFGMMGRIGKVIREDLGLAYYAFSHLEGGYGPGAWSVVAGINPAYVETVIERALEEIQRLTTEPVTDEDMDDNKSYFTGRLPLQLESNEGIASLLLSMENYQLGLDYLANYPDIIYRLTKEDLLAAARHYWNPDALVIAVAGPHNQMS